MQETDLKVGAILVNSMRQFTKIISIRKGIYGLSGWSSRANAEKATVAHKFVNVYGLKNGGVRVVKGSSKGSANAPAETSGDEATNKPTKAEINKLSADEAKALLKKETGEDVETGKAAKERLVTHFEL